MNVDFCLQQKWNYLMTAIQYIIKHCLGYLDEYFIFLKYIFACIVNLRCQQNIFLFETTFYFRSCSLRMIPPFPPSYYSLRFHLCDIDYVH